MARDKLGDERQVKTNEGRDVEMDPTLLKPSQILTIGKRRIKVQGSGLKTERKDEQQR